MRDDHIKDGICDGFDRTERISVFGKSVEVKNYICSRNGCPYSEKKKPVRLQLSIFPTMYCGAACPFCVMAGLTDQKKHLDITKLARLLTGLHEMDVIRGISITGGEPFTDVILLNEIVEMIFDICGIETEISINTNGTGIDRIFEIKRYDIIDAVHISRHHYDDARNRAYFNTDVPSAGLLGRITAGLNDPKLFVYNCLLLADGIGTVEEMAGMLEFAGRTGVHKVAFATPMPVNDYVRKNRVSYRELFDRVDERFLFTASYTDFEFCNCRDGVYVTSEGKLVEFYGKETMNITPGYVRGFVYGPDNILRTDFGKDAEDIAEM